MSDGTTPDNSIALPTTPNASNETTPGHVIMSPSPSFNAAAPVGVLRVSVPCLPPMPAPSDLVWICCNITYEQRKRRCTVCKGWKGGKRTAYKKKKTRQSVGTSSIASANTPSAAAPALEVNFNPTGAHPLSMSPMTGGGVPLRGPLMTVLPHPLLYPRQYSRRMICLRA